MKEPIKIELHEYTNSCADGCCTDYGTIIKVNNVILESRDSDTETIVQQILEYLGYKVEIQTTFDFE